MADPKFFIMAHRIFLLLLLLLCTGNIKAGSVDSLSVDGIQANTVISFATNNIIEDAQVSYKNTVYWKKHKVLKGCAWTALGIGVGGTVVGFIEKFGSTMNGNNEDALWDGIFISGVCLTVSSIPLFIYSHKNKKKALQAYVLVDNIRVNLPGEMKYSRPALGFGIYF